MKYPLLLLALIFPSCTPKPLDPPTVTTLEKSRYAGQWHEIARLPNPFEKGLIAAKATYGLNPDGTFSVLNEGLKKDGTRTSITGTATPADPAQPGKLLVRFHPFPANLFAGDYWILHVNPTYTRALVGSPNRKYLWILDKNPHDKTPYTPQISKATSLGYQAEKLIFNPQRIID